MAIYHGKKGALYISTSGSGTAAALAKLTNWTLSMSTDKVDVTSMQDVNKVYVQGQPDCQGTLTAWWDDTVDTLYTASRSDDGVKLYLYPSTLVPTKYWYGPAFVDFSAECGVGDAVKISGSWVAAGAWGQR